ncbi:MAG: glycosyltransferase family 2 protein [Thermoleophilaceae bacterium]|nr:glycosyltransferase family 2 protein [Thermoleophilaceae bacterium]
MSAPAVSVVVPTRNRADYLAVTLESLAAQRIDVPYEVVVVDDGSSDSTESVAERAGVAFKRHDSPRGPNAARNTGIAETTAPLVALVDDDVRAPAGWLAALVAGAARHEWAEALGGPIRASLEGPAPGVCGRESAPITTLDLGGADTETTFVWSANMAVRRSAVERIGVFDEDVPIYGDEEEWLIRLHAAGGRVAYVAGAGLDHRRAGGDAQLRSLARAEYRRGRAVRRNDHRKGTALSLPGELRNLAGAGWHTLRRRCPQGLIMGAHSVGRLAEALRRP